jgi:glycosyltransferase involved in cell wall biosynthesis
MSDHPLRIVVYTEGLAFCGDTIESQALGGSESAFIYLARALAAAGHRVTAVCRCPAPGSYHGVEYHDLRDFPEIASGPADLFLCSRFFRILRQPIAATVKLVWAHDNLAAPLVPELREVMATADGLYALSNYHLRQFRGAIPEFAGKFQVVHNGVDLQLIDPIADASSKEHRIMFTSRPERGLWDALDIYEALGDLTLELVICSYAGLPDPDVAALERRCDERIRDLRGRGFPIVTGAYPKAELYRWIAQSKAVIYLTRCSEIFCISAIEAQACGTVFLTTDDFAMVENVPYRRFDPNDKPTFVAELASLLADASSRSVLERRGRAFVRRFTWDAVADRLIADTRALVERRAQPRAAAVSTPSRSPERPKPMQNRAPLVTGALPMISCLTVTYDRLRLLKEAIDCYCRQTYPNRELVILTDGPQRFRRAVRRYLSELDRADLRLVEIDESGHRLGALRNLALDAALGEVVCQWDDDDRYHPERLERQAARLLEADASACFFTDQLQFFTADRRLYWIDWSHKHEQWGWIPGTLMMFRDPQLRYPGELSTGEDSDLATQLYQSHTVTTLAGMGHLYVYVYHGANTFEREHHELLAVCDGETHATLEERRLVLEAAMLHYRLPRPIRVFSRTGPAYDLL